MSASNHTNSRTKSGRRLKAPTPSPDLATSRATKAAGELAAMRFRTRHFAPDMEKRLRALAGAKTWRGFLAFFEDWLLISAGAGGVVLAVWLGPLAYFLMIPSWIVIGARMRALATLVHEASHRVLVGPRWLNALLGSAGSGWWVLQVLSRYTQSHVREHHPNLNQPALDPDAQQYLRQGILDQDPEKVVVNHLTAAATGRKTLVNLPYLLRDRLFPKPGVRISAWEVAELTGFCIAWAALLSVLTANGLLGWFVLIWVVPYFTTFQAINWLIEFAEHFPLQWTRSESFQRTRNRKGPAWEAFIFGAHGERWHRVHHERPYIPFYALKQAHAIMMEDEEYRAFEAETGGLLVRGPTGAPSILSAIAIETRRYQARKQEVVS